MPQNPQDPYQPLQQPGQPPEQQPPAQKAPKFNKLQGLQNMFQQSKGQGTQLAGAQATQKVQQGTTQSQQTANQGAVQQGQQAANNVSGQQNAYTIAPVASQADYNSVKANTKIDALNPISGDISRSNAANPVAFGLADQVNPGNVVGDPTAQYNASLSQLPTEAQLAGAHTQARNQLGAAQGEIASSQADALARVQANKVAQDTAIAKAAQDQSAYLQGLPQGDVANVGKQSALENKAEDINRVLTSSPSTSNLGALSTLFGQNYNTSRYGGLDSQVYQNQLQQMRQQAAQDQQGSKLAEQGKQAALRQYAGDITNAQKTIDPWVQAQQGKLKSSVSEAEKNINEAATNRLGELADVDAQASKASQGLANSKQALAKRLTDQKQIVADQEAEKAQAAAGAEAIKSDRATQQRMDDLKRSEGAGQGRGITYNTMSDEQLRKVAKNQLEDEKNPVRSFGAGKFGKY